MSDLDLAALRREFETATLGTLTALRAVTDPGHTSTTSTSWPFNPTVVLSLLDRITTAKHDLGGCCDSHA